MSNLKKISIKDTRNNLSHFIDQVAIANRQFLITKFGKPKAMLIPVEGKKAKPKKSLRDLPAFGMWKDRKDIKDTVKWAAELRRKQSLRIRD